MCCCNLPPQVVLTRKMVFRAHPTWNDQDCVGFGGAQRQMQWVFYVNGRFRHQTAYATPTTPLPFGSGTNWVVNATDEQITDYLIGVGLTVAEGDLIEVRVRIRNCEGQTALSNPIRLLAQLPSVDCECEFLTEYQSGITGDEATLPGEFTGQFFAFRNGLLNHLGNDFTAQPLEETDELMFATLSGCAATLDLEIVSEETGTVTVPGAFSGLAASQYLLFRNGVMQRGYLQAAGQVTPADSASDPTDEWLFARLENAIAGCTFTILSVGSGVSGATVTLPGGYNSTNQPDWILVRNGLVMYPNAGSDFGYSVSAGGIVTPTVPFSADTLWLVIIS